MPALHINGGGTATRADAERDCLAAIAFALEGDPSQYDADADTVTLDVTIAPAASADIAPGRFLAGPAHLACSALA
jgi:hypothetical protein